MQLRKLYGLVPANIFVITGLISDDELTVNESKKNHLKSFVISNYQNRESKNQTNFGVTR